MADLFFPPWLKEAAKNLGVHEGVGAANNPTVVQFYADAGFPGIKHDDVAWCAGFVGAMLKRAGYKPSGSLAARSYEAYGVNLHKPMFGCIGVKKRAGGGWLGHVGFVVAYDGSRVWMLGGNQGDKVSVAGFPVAQFTAFVVPKGTVLSALSPIPKVPPSNLKAVAGVVTEA